MKCEVVKTGKVPESTGSIRDVISNIRWLAIKRDTPNNSGLHSRMCTHTTHAHTHTKYYCSRKQAFFLTGKCIHSHRKSEHPILISASTQSDTGQNLSEGCTPPLRKLLWGESTKRSLFLCKSLIENSVGGRTIDSLKESCTEEKVQVSPGPC